MALHSKMDVLLVLSSFLTESFRSENYLILYYYYYYHYYGGFFWFILI